MSTLSTDLLGALKSEQEQLHEYTRAIYQLLIAWFTFWVTVNIAAIGLIAKELAGHPRFESAGIAIVGGFFIFQNGLSVPAMLWVHRTYGAMKRRSAEIDDLLGLAEISLTGPRVHTIVTNLYRKVLVLLTITMFSLVGLWAFLVAIATGVIKLK